MDDLLNKAGMDNKYEFVCLAIKRVRQLIKEKDRMNLLSPEEKLTNIVLREMAEKKIEMDKLEEEIKDK